MVRRSILEAAVQQGITHFDTAPLYGFGMAERDLAAILQQHSHVTITTKVGLYAPGGHDSMAAVITARKAAGKLFPSLSRPVADLSVDRARRSLEGSFRRLGRDRIDLLLIHEPDSRLLGAEEWLAWLNMEISQGRIGAFGLAAPPQVLVPFFQHGLPPSIVIQTQDSLDFAEADLAKTFGVDHQITYGYVSGARARGDTRPVTEILRLAMARQQDGAIIVSTTDKDRVAQYGRLFEDA
jgi:D-threo-aldose 1-dehydrogenase